MKHYTEKVIRNKKDKEHTLKSQLNESSWSGLQQQLKDYSPPFPVSKIGGLNI